MVDFGELVILFHFSGLRLVLMRYTTMPARGKIEITISWPSTLLSEDVAVARYD